ncbi:unnamed protein product [Paramecium octaurelia]|uniref:Uncharacterized protein n=1 Tax=Paramecium octaurelia TaxID=43137 RepID=A0A8S1S8Q3_PAROT|nr:unnamed protein product [Paramecium octaurelia]
MRKLYQPLKAPSLSPPSHQVSTYLDKQQRTGDQFYRSFPHSRSQLDDARSRCNFSSYYEQASEQKYLTTQFKSNEWNVKCENEKQKKQIEMLNDQITKLQKDLQIYKNQQVDKFDSDHQNLNKLMQGYQRKAQERKAIMKQLYSILKTKDQEIEELSQTYECQMDDMNNKMIQLKEQCDSQLFQQEDKIKQIEQVINSILYLKQSKLQELESKEQKMRDILQKLLKKQESKEKIDEVKNILTFIAKEKQKYQLKLPDNSEQQNNLSKEYQKIVTKYESVMMQINRLNQLITDQIKPAYTCEDSIYQLSYNIKEIIKQNSNIYKEIKQKEEEQTKQSNKLEKYKKQMEQKNSQIDSLKMDVKNLNQQLQNQETINSLNDCIKKQSQQIEILQQQIIEQNKILEQNEIIIAKQYEKENQLFSEIKMIKCEKVKSLQQDEDDQIKYKNTINDLRQEINELNSQLENMYTEQAQLQQQIDEQEIEHKKSQIQMTNTIQKFQLEIKKYQQLVEDNKIQFNQQLKQQQQQHKQIQQELINNQNQIQTQLSEYLQIIENLKSKENLNQVLDNLIDNLNLVIKQKLLQNLKSSSNLAQSPMKGMSKNSSPMRQILNHNNNNQIDLQKIHSTLDNISEQFQNRLNLLIKKDEKNQDLIQHYCQQIEESQQTIQQLCDDNDQQKQFITQMCKILNIEKIDDLKERMSFSKEDQSYIETLNQNNAQIQQLISYNQELQQDIQQQQIIIKDYEIQIDHLKNQIKYLSQEKEDQCKLTTQIASPTQSSRKDSIIKILQNEEIQNKDQQITELNDRISILNIENSNLQHQLESQIKLVQSKNEEIQNLNSQVRDLLEKQQYFEQLINELNAYHQQSKNQQEVQIIKLEGVSYDISHNSFNFDALRTPTNQNYIIDEIQQEQSINSSLSSIVQMSPNTQIKQIIQLNKQQEENIIQKNRLIQEKEVDLEKQNEELQQLQSINIKNDQEIIDLNLQLTQMHEKIETLIQEQSSIQQQNDEYTKKLKIEKESATNQIEQYKKEIQEVKSINDQLSTKLAESRIQLQMNQQEQITQTENKQIIYQQNKEIQLLKTINNENQIQISQQNNQMQNLQEQFDHLRSKSKNLILYTNSTIKEMKIVYAQELQQIKANLLQQQQLFKQDLQQLESKLFEIEQTYQCRIDNAQAKIQQFEQQIAEYQAKIQLLQQSKLQIEEKYFTAQNEFQGQSQFIDQQNSKLKSQKLQLELKEKQLKSIEIQFQEYSDQIEQSNQTKNTLQLEINSLQQILDQQLQEKNLIHDLNEQNSEKQQLLQQKEQQLKILNSELENLQLQLDGIVQNQREKEFNLNVQILDQQSQLEQYESSLKEVNQTLEKNKQEFQHKINLLQQVNQDLNEKNQNNIVQIKKLEINEELLNKKILKLEFELANIRNESAEKAMELSQTNQDYYKLLDNSKKEIQKAQILKDQNNKYEQEILQLKQNLQTKDHQSAGVNEQLNSSIQQNQDIQSQFTLKITELEKQIVNLDKEKLLLNESNEQLIREKHNYFQHQITKENLNEEKEIAIQSQGVKIQQLKDQLLREQENINNLQDSHQKQIQKYVNEKSEQIQQLTSNNQNLTLQLHESRQISSESLNHNDKLKIIINNQLTQIEQLEQAIIQYKNQFQDAQTKNENFVTLLHESEHKCINLNEQNNQFQLSIQQQQQLQIQQSQQILNQEEDLRQKASTIINLEKQIFEINNQLSYQQQVLEDSNIDKQKKLEQSQKDNDLQLQLVKQLQDKLNQCQTELQVLKCENNELRVVSEENINQTQSIKALYQNQLFQISELRNNISEFEEKEELNLKRIEELTIQLQNVVAEKEKQRLNQEAYVNSILKEKQLIEIQLNEVTQTGLKQIEFYKQEIAQLNQENEVVKKQLEDNLEMKKLVEEGLNQKVNNIALEFQQEIDQLKQKQYENQKAIEDQQNQLIIQVQQEKQQQNSLIAEINKIQNDFNNEISKNQQLMHENKRLQKFLSQSNLDKDLMHDRQQIEQGEQIINCDENKSLRQDNSISDRQQCVSVLYGISGNASENFENQMKSSCNQNQKIIVLQDKIAQLYDENDKLKRQQLQSLDDFIEISPLKESDLIKQLRQEIETLKADKEQGKAKSELQLEIVNLEKKLIKKDEEMQNLKKGTYIYIDMCEKAIVQDRDWMIDLNSLEERQANRWRIVCEKLVEYEHLQGEIMKNQNEIQELQLQIKNKENLSIKSMIMKQSQSLDDEDIFSIRSTVSKLRQELEQEKLENSKLKSYLKSYLKDEQRFEEQNQRVKEENKSLRNRISDQQEEIKQLNEQIQNCKDGALASHLISLLVKFFESYQKENKQDIKVFYQSLVSICRIEYNEQIVNKLFQSVEKKNQSVFGIFRRDKSKDK